MQTIRLDRLFDLHVTNFCLSTGIKEGKFIKDIRVGVGKYCAIILNQTQQKDSILIWNISADIEDRFVDVDKDHQVLWDFNGLAYILEKGKTTFLKESCSVTCYDQIEDMEPITRNGSTHPKINNTKGIRFDGFNHNWFIVSNYLSLGFNLMTFIIKEKIEQEDPL